MSRLDLKEADASTEDIKRIIDAIPSGYETGKKYLSGAYVVLRTEPKKARKLIRKAHEEIKKESAVAVEYNRVREGIRLSDDPHLGEIEEDYRRLLAQGNYRGAQKQVSKIVEGTRGLRHPLSVSAAGLGDGSIRIDNASDRSAIVVQVRSGSGAVFDPSSFEIQPFESRILRCSGFDGLSMEVMIEYRYAGADRSLTARVAFR